MNHTSVVNLQTHAFLFTPVLAYYIASVLVSDAELGTIHNNLSVLICLVFSTFKLENK